METLISETENRYGEAPKGLSDEEHAASGSDDFAYSSFKAQWEEHDMAVKQTAERTEAEGRRGTYQEEAQKGLQHTAAGAEAMCPSTIHTVS